MKLFAKWITNHPKTIVLIALLLLIPSILGYLGTFVNYDILSYLPDTLDSVKGETILDETFNNASCAFLVIEDMDAKDIVALKEKVEKVDGVSKVTWSDSIADISIPKEILPDVLTSIFYSKDGDSTLMLINFKHNSASADTMKAISDIRNVTNKQCFLSGLSVIMKDTKDLADKEAPIFIAIAIVLALIVMSFTMDSWIMPLVLLAALGLAVIYNMGTNIFLGQISYITQCIAAILQLGVTMDYSVFLIDRFSEEMKLTDNRQEAMAKAITKTFTSLIGSSLTTIFGFLALCFMSLTLGLDIGLVMAKGVLLGIITVVIVLPALVLLFYKPINKFRHKRIIPNFSHLNKFTIKNRVIVSILFIALLIPAIYGSINVEKYYNMDKALPQDLNSIISLNKMKDDFGMSMTHFIVIDKDTPSGDVTKMVDEIEHLDGINNVVSLNSYVGAGIDENMIPQQIIDICEKGDYRMMMINSYFATATDKANAQVNLINSILKKYDAGGYLTGEGALTKDLVDITSRDFTVTSIISMAAIFILIAIIFKSWSIPIFLVGLIESAILMNESISFFSGTIIPFIAPTVISCVQLGATVDYAILMTTRFKEERHRGLEKKDAILTAANASCQSIFQSALVFFSATFGVYLLCDIAIIKSLCSMLARGSIISAIIIMVVLPSLLYIFDGFINKTTIGWRIPKVKKNKKNKLSDEKEVQI